MNPDLTTVEYETAHAVWRTNIAIWQSLGATRATLSAILSMLDEKPSDAMKSIQDVLIRLKEVDQSLEQSQALINSVLKVGNAD